MNEIELITQQTDNWVKKVIMKYNICPFARREVERGSIRYLVVEQTKVKLVLKALIEECQYLDAHPEHETSLFILPRGFEGFYTYLDLVDMANDDPDYCFEDEPQDSAANFTNRAPYPTLHIIREASMELALANYNDPESIPERNIQFCERKGSEFFIKLLAECMGK